MTNHHPKNMHNVAEPGRQFKFVSVQNKDGRKDRTSTRLAKSHAVAWGLEKKRKLQLQSGHNFHVLSLEGSSDRRSNERKPSRGVGQYSLSETADPFQMLAAESPKLKALYNHYRAQQNVEPVFSISDDLVLQNFRLVVRESLDDHALLNSIMLTFLFAATAGAVYEEVLSYKGEALSSLRQRLSSPSKATSESTLGAILLLAGIEARQGSLHHVELHMGAIRQLLNVCRTKSVCLSDGIKRAIFWQDLHCSIMTGSNRVVDHTTFSELHWRRDPFSPNFYVLPPGFRKQAHLLGEVFIEVLKDVYALQCIRESALFGIEDVISMAHIDSHQASIQSRLVSLPYHSPLSECCYLTAYLCAAMLRCKMWRSSIIPSHMSLQLLCKLQQTSSDTVWDDQPELLAWILHIGGAFAPTGKIRSDYVKLLHLNRSTRLAGIYSSWPELLDMVKQFIWSDNAFSSQVKAFWGEASL